MHLPIVLVFAVFSAHLTKGLDSRSQSSPTPGSEPPFSPAILQEIERLSSLPSLISTSQLLAKIDPATLAAFLASNQYTNTNHSQPNPIANTFPNAATGTINGTLVVLSIEYDLARKIIPSQYGILRESIRAAVPTLPVNKYPLVLQGQLDHDIRDAGTSIPDFSSVQFRFPFIDLLNDGYSTFSYIPALFISNNPVAIAGSAAYAEEPIIATFDPPKDPYATLPGSLKEEFFLDVYRANRLVLKYTYHAQNGSCGQIGEYPLSFYANVTNQPTFGCSNQTCLLTCDNMIRFYGTNLTTGKFKPVGISGSISLAPSTDSGINFFPTGLNFTNVKGVRLDVAFLENNYRDCKSLEGYQYMGV